MKQLTIFGQQHNLKELKSGKDYVERGSNTIVVHRHQKTTKALLNEFLTKLLYDKLLETSKHIKAEGKVELFGDFDFEITESIDGKRRRIAKLKGNKILVKLNAIAFPETALKYIVAHEMAHIASKKHTRTFWKTVELICPDYKQAGVHLLESREEQPSSVSSLSKSHEG